MKKIISRTVWILSLVSFFNDIASEMLYPIMPIFLSSIGFSALLIGLLEGLAEGVAGLSKGYFGNWSDRVGKRMPFVRLGYGLSALAKPMLAISNWISLIFLARTADRLGKGIRTGARDAVLSEESTPETKGRVFGLHRAMDSLGAVAGPLIALWYLASHPSAYRALFFIAFIPGVVSILATFLIREKSAQVIVEKKRPSAFQFFQYWKRSSPEYRKIAGGLLVWTLFNSSDYFLLLRMKSVGIPDVTLILVYVFYNIVYALSSYPFGSMGDRIGLKTTMLLGLIFFAAAYFGIAFVTQPIWFFAMFFVYGLYAGSTDGVSKAWLANVSRGPEIGTALGTFAGFQSVCAVLASILTGALWNTAGPTIALSATAIITIAVVLYFVFTPINERVDFQPTGYS